jgi:hypothetical protein
MTRWLVNSSRGPKAAKEPKFFPRIPLREADNWGVAELAEEHAVCLELPLLLNWLEVIYADLQ